MIEPTPFSDVNRLLDELLIGVKEILTHHFIAMYLDGSLALGDFDQDSDVDFVVVSDIDVAGDLFTELQPLHQRMATPDSPFAIQLEGFYISQDALRRFDPLSSNCPNIERGRGEQLKMVHLGLDWQIYRWVLRNHGIVMAGPPPNTLIDPISAGQLRCAMLAILQEWTTLIQTGASHLTQSRGWQSYVVLTMGRILYTLKHGTVTTKRAAARWAQSAFGEPWASLIERAWLGRHIPDLPVQPEDVDETIAWIRFSASHAQIPDPNEMSEKTTGL